MKVRWYIPSDQINSNKLLMAVTLTSWHSINTCEETNVEERGPCGASLLSCSTAIRIAVCFLEPTKLEEFNLPRVT